MTEQLYRVIADRDKGDDPTWADINTHDRATYEYTNGGPAHVDQVIRIERPVSTTTSLEPMRLTDAEADSFHAAMQDQRPSVPTREQIAEALYENQFRGGYHAEWDRLVDDARDFWLSQADAVLALLRNGGTP